MSNNLDEILSLTKEISFQDSEDIDITVTEYGEKLSETDDIEFLWVARNTSTTVKNASSNIKNFNDQNIANNINQNGPVRLGDEVFVFNKSYSWKVHDLKKFIQWVVEKSKDNDDLVDSLLAIMGQTFVPKLKGLDAFSNSRDINPEMIRDTFLYKEWREKSELKAINTNNTSAPKWAKELGHKERKKMNQLYELSRQFPDEWIKPAPKGKFGNYIPHSVITQRLLEVCGPFNWEVVELIRQENSGKVVGCFGKLTTLIDGKSVTITSIGDVEHDQGSDGMNAKHAESDAFKRCAMKVGLGLHLWAGEEYYLDKKLSEAEGKKNIKLQSA